MFFKSPTVNVIFKGEDKRFFLRPRYVLPLLLTMVLEVLARVIQQEQAKGHPN